MNLLNKRKLKQEFEKIYTKNNRGEIMEYKTLLDKILSDFEESAKVLNALNGNLVNNKTLNSTYENNTDNALNNLKEQKEIATNNLDIQKIKNIDTEIETILNKSKTE